MLKLWDGARFVLLMAIIVLTARPAARALAFQQTAAPAQPAAPQQAADVDADAVILDRQLVMQQLDKDTEALGLIISGVGSPDTLPTHAKAIAKGAKEVIKAFEPKVPGGASKPEVWTNWADFSKRIETFAIKSEEMAKASENGNLAVVGELMIGALQCKQCHDVYRVKK